MLRSPRRRMRIRGTMRAALRCAAPGRALMVFVAGLSARRSGAQHARNREQDRRQHKLLPCLPTPAGPVAAAFSVSVRAFRLSRPAHQFPQHRIHSPLFPLYDDLFSVQRAKTAAKAKSCLLVYRPHLPTAHSMTERWHCSLRAFNLSNLNALLVDEPAPGSPG